MDASAKDKARKTYEQLRLEHNERCKDPQVAVLNWWMYILGGSLKSAGLRNFEAGGGEAGSDDGAVCYFFVERVLMRMQPAWREVARMAAGDDAEWMITPERLFELGEGELILAAPCKRRERLIQMFMFRLGELLKRDPLPLTFEPFYMA